MFMVITKIKMEGSTATNILIVLIKVLIIQL